MKIRLLENVTHAGLNGCKGQVLELDDATAIDLEKHGHAEFVGEDADEMNARVRTKADDAGAAAASSDGESGDDDTRTTPKKKKK